VERCCRSVFNDTCVVSTLQVSWLKRDEKGILQLLTYGQTTYSSDTRQSPQFVEPNDWQLRLSSVQRSDGGNYQCQMSTHPPRILHYTLNVIGKLLLARRDLIRFQALPFTFLPHICHRIHKFLRQLFLQARSSEWRLHFLLCII